MDKSANQNASLAYLGLQFQSLRNAITNLKVESPQLLSTLKQLVSAIQDDQRLRRDDTHKILTSIQTLASSLTRFQVTPKVTVGSPNVVLDLSSLEEKLEALKPEKPHDHTPHFKMLSSALDKLLKKEQTVDFSPVIQAIQNMKEEKSEKEETSFEPVIKQLKKLEKSILKELQDSSWKDPKYILGGGGGGTAPAKRAQVANTTMTSANTEYSYTFPNGTVGWSVRLRADDIPLLISFETGKLPTSGDGSAYFTVPAYYIAEREGIDWSNKTIYLQAGTASQTAEFIVYTK